MKAERERERKTGGIKGERGTKSVRKKWISGRRDRWETKRNGGMERGDDGRRWGVRG